MELNSKEQKTYDTIAKIMNNNYLILPYAILIFIILMIISHELINIRLNKRDLSLQEDEKKNYNI